MVLYSENSTRNTGNIHFKMSDNSEILQKKRGWPKGKKRGKKLLKDENAPKKPVNGYVLFMNERRESLSKEHPSLSFAEVTKLLGEEWSSMSLDLKDVYLNQAEKHKKRYFAELKTYRESEAYKAFIKKSNQTSSTKRTSAGTRRSPFEEKKPTAPKFEDPIFTEGFLDYNKAKESELHQLNRTNAEYEQHNSLLESHIENLETANVKLEAEIKLQDIENKSLESKLQYFQELLQRAFSHIPLPTTQESPTVNSIDSYMQEVCNLLEKNANTYPEFATAVYDAMANVSFQTLDVYDKGQEKKEND